MTQRVEPYTAEELRIWRARERLSQADVAELFNASQRSISHWENGQLPRDFSERFEEVLMAYYRQEQAP
jgi:DNA-binding transcriptional regulator YiaG